MKAIFPDPGLMIHTMGLKFLEGFETKIVKGHKWQGLEIHRNLIEIFDTVIRTRIPENVTDLAKSCQPDLPWADDHFEERIAGIPTNPGKTYKNWPYYKEDEYRKDGVFTHTYQERYFPKDAGGSSLKKGIRYEYGDLIDLIKLLDRDPGTRQAYLPVWFPEDTGVIHGGRVPCTLGYLFNIREGFLHCSYYLRSCDYIRHFKNDVYLTARLMIHIVKTLNDRGHELRVGQLKMDIDSFHIFESDLYTLTKKYKNKTL